MTLPIGSMYGIFGGTARRASHGSLARHYANNIKMDALLVEIYSSGLEVADFCPPLWDVTLSRASTTFYLEGHVWVGAPCSSWIWLSRGSTRRCQLRPRGNKAIRSVKKANRLVRRICYMHLAYMYFVSIVADIWELWDTLVWQICAHNGPHHLRSQMQSTKGHSNLDGFHRSGRQ